MSESIFRAAPFYLFRAPLWPKHSKEKVESGAFSDICSKDGVELIQLFDDHLDLQEAIYLASSSLFYSLKERPLKNPEQALVSLRNYASRMSTRATPFGMFSFVAMGAWSEKTEAFVDLKALKKGVRPDMEWLWRYVQQLNAGALLPFKTHPLVTSQGLRACLNYRYHTTEEEPLKPISIRLTGLVNSILNLAKEGITFDQLWAKLKNHQLEKSKTFEVVKFLLKEQFLLPDIFPSLFALAPYQTLSSYIPAYLIEGIHNYSKLPIGEGYELLISLQEKMNFLSHSKNKLQVDTCYSEKAICLPYGIKEELEQAVSFWWKLSACLDPTSLLQNYLKRFLDRYGTHRTVPLTELLSEDKGLGSFEASPFLLDTKFTKLWKTWLQQQSQECLRDKKFEIVITESLLENLFQLSQTTPPNPTEALNSLDIFCRVFATSTKEIDQGAYLAYLSEPSWQGGSSIGRFLYLFDKKVQNDLEAFYHDEEQLDPHASFVTVSYWPSSVRYANVASQPCLSTLRLDLHGKGGLQLNDLYIGATKSRFYVTLKGGETEVVVRCGNLLNPAAAPLPLQFLRFVTLSRCYKLHPFSWGVQAPFLPRLRFSKTLLSLAKWHFDSSLVAHAPIKIIEEIFIEWAEKWCLPQQFNLVQDDQHLFMDRQNPLCLRELIQKIKQGRSLSFSEEIDSSWVISEKGAHSTELVVPFLKDPAFTRKSRTFIPAPYLSVPFEKRWKLPGSEWLYVKFYLHADDQDRFLIEHLAIWAESLNCSSWFFTRYCDPEDHIRFRIKLNSSQKLAAVLVSLEKLAMRWLKEGLIRKMSLDCYEREIERYNSPELMDIVEEVFYADTLAVLLLLQTPLEKPVIRTLSVLTFLKECALTKEEMISFFLTKEEEHAYLKGFRQYKNELFKRAKDLRPVEKRASSLVNIPEKVRPMLYKSLLHMHCNRLGCDNAEEKQAYQFAGQVCRRF